MAPTFFKVWDGAIPDALCDTLCQVIESEQDWMMSSGVKQLPVGGVWCALIALVQITLPSDMEVKGDSVFVRKNLARTHLPWHNDRPAVGSHTGIVYLNNVSGGELEVLGDDRKHQIEACKGRLVILDIKLPHRALLIKPASSKFTAMIPLGQLK